MDNFIFSKKVLKSIVLIMFLILSTLAIIFFPHIKGKIKKEKVDDVGKIYQQSLSLIEKGDFKQATELLEKTIKISPNAINYLQTLAIAKYNSKDYQGAISVYEKMIKIDSKSAFAYNGIGNAFRDLKDFKQAEENYQKAIKIDQYFIASYTNLALVLKEQGKKDEAKKILENGLEVNPNSAELKTVMEVIE